MVKLAPQEGGKRSTHRGMLLSLVRSKFLSRCFRSYHSYSVIKKIDKACNVLTSRYLSGEVQRGPFAAKSLKQIENSEVNVTYGLPWRGSSDVEKNTEKNVVAFVRAAVDNLRSRFPNVELFQASKIFDATNLPSSLEEFCTYRDEELELLTTTYSELIDYSKCVLDRMGYVQGNNEGKIQGMQVLQVNY